MKYLRNVPCLAVAARRVILLGVLGVLPCVAPVHATSATAPVNPAFAGTVTLHDGKLTARLSAVPLRRVMAEVSRLSGAQVLWLRGVREEPVSVEFTALPLTEALQRLLGGNNFLLFYTSVGEEAKLTQVWIASRGQGREPMRFAPPLGTDAGVPPSPASDPPSGGMETIDTIIHTATQDPDPTMRLVSVSQLGMRAQEDVRVKAVLTQMAHSDHDPQVRNVAAEMLYSLENQEEEEEVEEED